MHYKKKIKNTPYQAQEAYAINLWKIVEGTAQVKCYQIFIYCIGTFTPKFHEIDASDLVR